ncbi:rhamnogalacturonan lyase B N-terminal domain-containing protein [Verrucomicrobium sp. BvORR034]|uniref:rhamnogalacturonan lyase B N-terminal domain-containing protein n=1 Tax=Verrucomicrobium sp. BvORR034 TaxID=1396418 RepID=UPI002240EBFD|nr:rhamnogalacturonan lyase B N-terminal domain-containing protein [Verrucomicrobium sp. BvORR034]
MSRALGLLLAILAGSLLSSHNALAEFGLITEKKQHRVDTGAGLVFKVDRLNGGIRSIKWQDTELHSPFRDSSSNSGVGGSHTTVTTQVDGETIIITTQTDAENEVVADLTHYYIVRKGLNHLYMATYAQNEPSNGELRWITRLKGDLFPNAPAQSDLRGSTGAIESRDVLGMADGTSRSKYFGNDQARDLGVRGVTGRGRGVFMVYGNRESSAGGPFYRDIQNQTSTAAEVYNYMNSGHNQTEKLRLGVLYGPYVLCFTDGSKPKAPDLSFIDALGLKGSVNKEARGSVQLRGLKGRDEDQEYSLDVANGTAQYWAPVSKGRGSATSPDMKPGMYALTVYKGELAVHTETVTVTASAITEVGSRTLTADPSQTKPLWRIGDWDGTPLEFRKGRSIALMHPSDKRMEPWQGEPFVIGQSRAGAFPSCLWSDVNGQQVVKFQLTPEQVASRTLRVGITASFAGARPSVKLNTWKASIQPAPRKVDSRSLTIGSYRGNNATYTFRIPAQALVAGENVLTLSVVSGNRGPQFLSPGYGIDCVDFY